MADRHKVDVKGVEYTVLVEKGEKHGYVAEVEDDPNIFTDGETVEEAQDNIKKLILEMRSWY